MKTLWTKGLDEQTTKELKANFKESLITRRRISDILEGMIKSSRCVCVSKDTYYKTPNWPLMQADGVGYERALREVMSIVHEENKN